VAVLSCISISSCLAADPSLTIYNQQFAVVRETVPLNLKQGINQIEFNGATALLEPESLPFTKTDSQTIEFHVPLEPGEEKTITYAAHYTW
jgi:hypothetical protein